MNEIAFKKWLSEKGVSKKMQSDHTSRLKRIEHEIDQCDLDEQYRIDKCQYLMSLFTHMGLNSEMKKYPQANFPIGKYYMGTYIYAIRKYVLFCDEISISDKK